MGVWKVVKNLWTLHSGPRSKGYVVREFDSRERQEGMERKLKGLYMACADAKTGAPFNFESFRYSDMLSHMDKWKSIEISGFLNIAVRGQGIQCPGTNPVDPLNCLVSTGDLRSFQGNEDRNVILICGKEVKSPMKNKKYLVGRGKTEDGFGNAGVYCVRQNGNDYKVYGNTGLVCDGSLSRAQLLFENIDNKHLIITNIGQRDLEITVAEERVNI